MRAIATQAARLAANADILIARARDEAGIDLDVISPEEEADLAALGCAPLIGRKYKGALIFDIGGGSTEIIWLHKSDGGLAETLLRLAAGGRGDPGRRLWRRRPPPRRLRDHARRPCGRASRLCAEQTRGFDPARDHLLGTSGTVTTLAAIALKLPRYNRARVDAQLA